MLFFGFFFFFVFCNPLSIIFSLSFIAPATSLSVR